jgi:high-affinity iron transporter
MFRFCGSRSKVWVWAFLAGVMLLAGVRSARAASESIWQSADAVDKTMRKAQVALIVGDNAATARAVAQAEKIYRQQLAARSGSATNALEKDFASAATAARQGAAPAFAAAYAGLWTELLRLGYSQTLAALQRGDAGAAQRWLLLREFRPASRFVRPNTDATKVLNEVRAGTITPREAVSVVRTDLLDTYQSKLNEALHELNKADERGLAASRARYAALANGYFAILSPFYGAQRGGAAQRKIQSDFAAMRDAARAGQPVGALLATVKTPLEDFRAAPLSSEEQVRRAGQMMRFLSLVAMEYERGVSGGQVTIELEIQEAVTFRDGAEAAFSDLRSLLDKRDHAKTRQFAALLSELGDKLSAAQKKTAVASPSAIQNDCDALEALARELMPPEWQKHNSAADFDIIQVALDQMEAAVAAGQYDLAKSARLEAYAILESGPEAKLVVFAPQYKPILENLFWYGQDERKGLAYLLDQRASAGEIRASREALNEALKGAQQALGGGNSAPGAVAINAAVIVFREGLEAVLILASLMGSLKLGEQRRFRKPLWIGALLALMASGLTWMLMQGVLRSLARYGEKLEAVVSLIAIVVLLLITNWFFHKVYWTGWMANFHSRKKQLIGGEAGQMLGLLLLGFSSIYREGFETVLFLQALVLESGTKIVLGGVAMGLALTSLIGIAVFLLQARLPHKKMLIATGMMIGAVLLIMVGNTVNVMQVVGWMPLHPIRWLPLPYWTGLWFGLFATWEGIGLQTAALIFVGGSYYLAEHRKHAGGKPALNKNERPQAPSRLTQAKASRVTE